MQHANIWKRTLPCFGHNSSKYDIKFILTGIKSSKVKFLSKSGDNFLSVKVKNTFKSGINDDDKHYEDEIEPHDWDSCDRYGNEEQYQEGVSTDDKKRIKN